MQGPEGVAHVRPPIRRMRRMNNNDQMNSRAQTSSSITGHRHDDSFAAPRAAADERTPEQCPRRNYPVGEDPDAEKRALEIKHCDPAVREPFIAALVSVEQPQR